MKKYLILLFAIITFNNLASAQWTEVNTGLPNAGVNTQVEYFAIVGTNLFAATDAGVYMTTDSGATWTGVNAVITNTDIEALAAVNTNLFAGTGHGIFKSTNSGTSWTPINTGLDTSMGHSVYSFFVSGTNLYAGTEAGVFLSIPPYTSWTAVNTGLPTFDFYAFAQSGNYIFSGGMGVYRTSNDGANWYEMTIGLPSILNSDFESFAVIGSNVFAGDLSLGVFKSTDTGTTWTAVNTGLPDLNTQALIANGTGLVAGGLDSGVYFSSNYGASWSPMNTGLTSRFVQSFGIFGNYLFAGTEGGVFRAPLSSFAGINEMQNEDLNINIYPNPAKDKINVISNRYSVNGIEIYNVLGEKIYSKTLSEYRIPTTEYLLPITINVNDMPGGVYFIEVKTEKGVESRKFVKL